MHQYRVITTGLLLISSVTILSGCSPSSIGKGLGKLASKAIAEKTNEQTDEEYESGSNYSPNSPSSSFGQREGHAYKAPHGKGELVTFTYDDPYTSNSYTACGIIVSWDGAKYEIDIPAKNPDGTMGTKRIHNVPQDDAVDGCQ